MICGLEPATKLAAASSLKRILVVGAKDSGKSTLCRILQSAAVSAGRSGAILGLDVGQKMIGPPACVTLGVATEAGAVAVLIGLAFAQTTDPIRACDLTGWFWTGLIEKISQDRRSWT